MLRSRKFFMLALVFFCFCITGCATQAPTLNFVPKDVLPSSTKIDFELKSTSISIAQDDERTGPTQVGLFGNQYESSFKQAFKDALEEAISKAAIFNDLSQRKLTLSAKILQFETPGFSTGFETKIVVRYQLLNRSNGKLVFTRDITATGVVPFDYAFNGAIRYTEARNRAGRDNIQQFIGSLAEFKDGGNK